MSKINILPTARVTLMVDVLVETSYGEGWDVVKMHDQIAKEAVERVKEAITAKAGLKVHSLGVESVSTTTKRVWP